MHAVLSLLLLSVAAGDGPVYDVVVYGGTSGGVIAAIQTAQMGKSVVLIEPGRRLGGLTSGGLGATDIGNKKAIGGLSREFYHRVWKHYHQATSWKRETAEDYQKFRKGRGVDADTMWGFEPHVAEAIYEQWIKEAKVPVVLSQRLDLKQGVRKDGARITAIVMESGKVFAGRMFIDATYEGDLMAKAGVSYTVGREPNAQYSETLNGVQPGQAKYHQFLPGVDPYVTKGDPQSGLLPFLEAKGLEPAGSGDHRVQAYCYRMCLTDDPENRIPFRKPEGYAERTYELLLRNFEAGERGMPWINTPMPNRKTDTNNRTGFSTDFIGQNYRYPDASYAEREEIARLHRLYQQGLMWTLANHPRVPEKIRSEVARWGMCKDEFREGEGWQEQLYVREARRMVSDYVMTELNCRGTQKAEDPVGLGAYGMDSHHVQRYVDASGQVRNEGDVEVGGFSPYPISYRSIVPKASQCTNLLVPICLSASHISYGSIRMEPVFMILGQSSATAAVMAIDAGVGVQQVDYAKLRQRLLDAQQVLEWTGAATKGGKGVDPKTLPGVVVDDADAKLTGEWLHGSVTGPFVGSGYAHDGGADKKDKSARFEARLPAAGKYEVRLAYPANPNRCRNVPVTVQASDGPHTVHVDQQKPGPIVGLFVSLGVFSFDAAQPAVVEIRCADTKGYVIVDAVQFLPAK